LRWLGASFARFFDSSSRKLGRFSSRMTLWWTTRSIAAAVVIGSLKMVSHFENGRLLVIRTLPRS
jgi:hypothetical protein